MKGKGGMMEDDGPAELDLRNLFSLFWRNKYVFFVSIVVALLSSTYFVSKASKIYEAEALVELEKGSDANSIDNVFRTQVDLGSLLSDGTQQKESGIIPTIMGREFIISLDEKYDIKSKLGYSYSFSNPSLFSFAGILVRLGIFSYDAPNEEQASETLVNKIRSLITIKRYKYGQIKTNAYKITVKHKDPFIAAFIANKLIKHFFEIVEDRDRDKYKNQTQFLSRNLAEAQQNYANSQKQIENFLIKHPSFFEGSLFQANDMNTVSSDGEKRVSELIDLTFQNEELRASLDKLNEINKQQKIISRDFDTITNRSNLSNSFLNGIIAIDRENISPKVKIAKFKSKISAEIKRLETLLAKIQSFIEAREREVTDDLDLNEAFSQLRLELTIDKNYFENTKAAFKDFTLQGGREMLSKNLIYSQAVPPIYPVSPNIRYILMLNLAFFTLCAAIFVFFRQILRPIVFDLNQLTGAYSFNHKMKFSKNISLFPLKNSLSSSISSNMDLGFFNAFKSRGKIGCFIEVGEKTFMDKDLSVAVPVIFSKLLSSSNSKTYCIAKKFEENSDKVAKQNFEINRGEEENKRRPDFVVTSEKEMNLIEGMELFPLSSGYEEFDRIFIAANKNLKFQAKFYLIENCDFFVLVGKAGYFGKKHLDQFITDQKLFNNKCLGFVLVD